MPCTAPPDILQKAPATSTDMILIRYSTATLKRPRDAALRFRGGAQGASLLDPKAAQYKQVYDQAQATTSEKRPFPKDRGKARQTAQR